MVIFLSATERSERTVQQEILESSCWVYGIETLSSSDLELLDRISQWCGKNDFLMEAYWYSIALFAEIQHPADSIVTASIPFD